jgi:serine/threonine-protein kinase HipA
LFTYLFSNGDADFKNFSLIKTELGDYKLSPAYDLLNSRIHVAGKDFALDDGLLLPALSKGKVHEVFLKLGEMAQINRNLIDDTFSLLTSKKDDVLSLISHSYLSDKLKRNYEQAYLTRLKNLIRN